MAWTEFPLDGGACNDKDPFALKQGEFSEASGVAYKPDSKQLHNDLSWTEWNFRPSDLGTNIYGWKGPFYLSFEGKNDWIMLVATRRTGIESVSYDGVIYFARADGQGTGWILSDYTLTDNVGNQSEVTAASIAHWGDRYYLATDMGCAEIAPPTGTGVPLVTRLGLHVAEGDVYPSGFAYSRRYPKYPAMLLVGSAAAGTFLGADSGSVTFSTSSGSTIQANDAYTLYITEFNAETGLESQPVWFYERAIAAANDEYPIVRFPAAFINEGAASFRIYLKFEGVSNDSAAFKASQYYRKLYEDAITGAGLLYRDDGLAFGFAVKSEFSLGETSQFSEISRDTIENPLPVLGLDNARLIYSAYRAPNCATTAVIWNDSLILNDSGFNRGEDVFVESEIYGDFPGASGTRRAEPAPSLIRYSPPGDPHNQLVPYFMNFASEREDVIRATKVVNDRLIVLCDSAVHSVRYLPFNNLLASQQGRVKDVVTTNVGLASPAAVVKVETGRGEMCVWLSNRGLEWSDGSAWDDACPDFAVPDGDDATTGVLVNLPKEYRIDLYLGTKLYSFYYHPSHMKGGRLKMLGPTELNARIYGACEYKGTVYRFDGVDIEWTSGEQSSTTGTVYTGHIRGSNPFKDLNIKDLGLAHGVVDGTLSMRCDAAVTGNSLSIGNEVQVPNPELEEVGAAGMAQRGTYVRFKLDVTAVGDWAVGPVWVSGGEESGGNG